MGYTSPVQQKRRRLDYKIRSFAVDKEMDRLIKAGAKLEGNVSSFLRAAIERYFDK